MIAQTDEEKHQYDRRMRQWRDEAEREHQMKTERMIGKIQALQQLLGEPESSREELGNCTIAELEVRFEEVFHRANARRT